MQSVWKTSVCMIMPVFLLIAAAVYPAHAEKRLIKGKKNLVEGKHDKALKRIEKLKKDKTTKALTPITIDQSALEDEEIEIVLPDGKKISFKKREYRHKSGPGVKHWKGKCENDPSTSISLTYDDNSLLGYIRTGIGKKHRLFKLTRADDEGTYILWELDWTKFEMD